VRPQNPKSSPSSPPSRSNLLYVSAVTFAEIRSIERVADAGRRAELNDWLAHKVRPMFEQRVLAITEDIMFKWRLLVEDGRKAGAQTNHGLRQGS
jgi:toxin FitB